MMDTSKVWDYIIGICCATIVFTIGHWVGRYYPIGGPVPNNLDQSVAIEMHYPEECIGNLGFQVDVVLLDSTDIR